MNKLMSLMGGVKVISKALKTFEKATSELEKGVELCKFEILNKDETIACIENERKDLVECQEHGERVIEKIKDLIS